MDFPEKAFRVKLLKIFFIGLGCFILYTTMKSVGFENIGSQIAELNLRLWPLLVIYPVIFAFDTLGWAYAFPGDYPKHIPFSGLYAARIIGEALNVIIPFSASLGGEPVKAEILKRRYGLPLSEGYASILIVHTTFWISLNIFVIGGVLLTVKTLPLTPVLWHSVLAFLVSLAFVAMFLIVGLHFGIFKRIHSLGHRLRWWGAETDEKRERLIQLDQRIKKFYTEDRRRFFFSTFFNFLGWLTGSLEVYFIAHLVGMPVSFTEAWLLEALIQVLRIVTFFIPGSLGAQEGGIVLIFSQFGFGQQASVMFAVIRRLREVVWVGGGLILWSLLKDKPSTKNIVHKA